MDSKEESRQKILDNLESYGVHFDVTTGRLVAPNLREMQNQLALQTNTRGLSYRNKVIDSFAKPNEINILKVNPYLIVVDSIRLNRIWSYACSFWSIPITNGYGRRIRILVIDRNNQKLIGIIGLADPIIGLGARDSFIGWSKEQKIKRLYNCMTAYILGAVPPYNLIFGSKLVALTTMFPQVRKIFYEKYKDTIPIISGNKKIPHLVYIDTLGAFGKSAIYTRLQNWKFVGYTKGQSHIHITANGSWDMIKQLVPESAFRTYKYGQGPNWKMRILKAGLKELGFSNDMLSIGWQRGYYSCPLAENWKEYLNGETNKIIWKSYTESELINYWREKWLIPRLDKLRDKLTSFESKLR
jgi:hypothetical protein